MAAFLCLSSRHRCELIDHVQSALPEEACGLIAGREGICTLLLPVTNVLHSPTRFRMDPSEQWRALRKIEDEHLDLLAIYHSHPTGPPHPSARDLAEFAYPTVFYLILSRLAHASEWHFAAFDLKNGQIEEILLQEGDRCVPE